MPELGLAEDLAGLTVEQLEVLYASLGNYERIPPHMDEFLDSSEYLGGYFQGKLHPYWRDSLETIYPSPFVNPYWLIALRGSIGQGKTTAACAGVAYDLMKLQCMEIPQKIADLVPSTRILFAIFNVTMSLATDVVWSCLSQMFASSPYFTRLMAPLGSRRKKKGDSLFPKNVDFFMGSRIGHTLGKAVLEIVLDEANFEIVGGQVYDTFNSALSRMESRFMTPGGGIAGKAWVISSESDKFSVVNQITDSFRAKDGVFVSQASLWEVVPHRYGKERFIVFKGSETRQPEILEANDESEPELCIDVPVEHRERFEADIHAALRDLAGVSTGTSYKLFRHRERLSRAFTVAPLFPETVKLDFDDDFDQLANYLVFKNYFKNPIHKYMPRWIHIDIGLSGDRLGIAGAFCAGFKQRVSHDVATFQKITEDVPLIVGEWCVGLEPKGGKQIPLYKVRSFIQWLGVQSYPIAGVSLDGFQSADTCQLLTKMGYAAEIFSMDITSHPFVTFRNSVYEERVQLPNSMLLRRELQELELTPDGKKVDHPRQNSDNTKGSKDVADAMGGACYKIELIAHKYKLLHAVARDSLTKQHAQSETANMFWPTEDR